MIEDPMEIVRYTKEDWQKELQTYRTSKQAAAETLEGTADHLDQECDSDATQTVPTTGPQPRPPFKQSKVRCDRGTLGCGRKHNDLMALEFACMGLARVVSLQNKGK